MTVVFSKRRAVFPSLQIKICLSECYCDKRLIIMPFPIHAPIDCQRRSFKKRTRVPLSSFFDLIFIFKADSNRKDGRGQIFQTGLRQISKSRFLSILQFRVSYGALAPLISFLHLSTYRVVIPCLKLQITPRLPSFDMMTMHVVVLILLPVSDGVKIRISCNSWSAARFAIRQNKTK